MNIPRFGWARTVVILSLPVKAISYVVLLPDIFGDIVTKPEKPLRIMICELFEFDPVAQTDLATRLFDPTAPLEFLQLA